MLLYWNAMRDRISINEWEYAVEEAMAKETFHKVPLPATMMPYCLEYREERRRQWLLRQHEQERLLLAAEDPSRDPSFPGTETERRAWAAKNAEVLRAKLEAKWAAAEAQGWRGSKPYRALRPEELDYRPSEDPVKARQRAMSLLADLRREEEGSHGSLH